MLRICNQTLRNISKKAGLGAAEKSRDQLQTDPSYLRFFLGQTGWVPLCHRCTELKNSSIFQSWSKPVASGGTSGQQWSIHTLVLCLIQEKTQGMGLAVTGLQPGASATSQIPWSTPDIPPSPFPRHNLLWEMLTRWKVKLYLEQSSSESHVTALIC